MTTRRNFLGGILAFGAAPAIVKSSSLMKIWVPPQELFVFEPVTVEKIAPFTATELQFQNNQYIDNLAKSIKISNRVFIEMFPKLYTVNL